MSRSISLNQWLLGGAVVLAAGAANYYATRRAQLLEAEQTDLRIRLEKSVSRRITAPVARQGPSPAPHHDDARAAAMREPEPVPEEASPGVPQVIPVASLRNAGLDTPEATIETLAWSASNGDHRAMAAAMIIEGDAAKEAVELFESLAEEDKRRFGSPSVLVAALTQRDFPPSDITLIRLVVQRSGDVILSAAIADTRSRQAGKTRTLSLGLRRTADGWKAILPANRVANYAAEIAESGLP